MKKNLVFCASMLACLTFAMAGCEKSSEPKPSKPGVVEPSAPEASKPNTESKVVSFEQAYDASVLSGIGLLNSGVSNPALMGYSVSLMADVTSTEATEEKTEAAKPEDNKTEDNKTEAAKPENGLDKLNEGLKKEILDNLAIANSTLNGDSTKSEILKSDRAEWEQMYTITQKDISGNDVVYTFYFTETLGNEEEEENKEKKSILAKEEKTEGKEDNEESKKDEEEKPEENKTEEGKPEENKTEAAKPEDNKTEEEEIEKHIKGVVVALDKEYEVSGDREIEGNEESVTYKIMLDKDNYVIIENEVEGTENEYEYSKYENGKRVFKSEVEYEMNENGEVEIEFETKTPEEGKVKFSYEFVKENDESLIKVEIKKAKDNIKSEAVIKAVLNENEEISYEFIDYIEKK